jgi:hypothetical protein
VVRYAVQARPGRTRNVKRRDVIRHEAHALANRLLGKADLPRVVETRQLWDEATGAAVDPDDLDPDKETGELPRAAEEDGSGEEGGDRGAPAEGPSC